MKGIQKMSKRTREHISIRLNPEKDSDILIWYESLPHYERSAYVKDALKRYIGGRFNPAPHYRQVNSNLDNYISADNADLQDSVGITDESSADEAKNNIDEWKDLV